MIYLIIFWAAFLIFISLNVLGKKTNVKILKSFVNFSEDKGILFFMVLGIIALMAIVTKDPISFGQIEVPMEIQWIATLLAAIFGAWKYYLNPLKESVINVEKEVSSMKSDVGSIKSDMHLIKDKILNIRMS